MEGLGICRNEIRQSSIWRDWRVGVGVRVRGSMMIAQFDHENLRVYQAAIGFVAWLEEVTPGISSKVSACDHLARASAGIPINIAEASGKRSMKERCRFIGHARTAALQAAATLDVLAVRQVKCKQDATAGKSGLIDIVRMLVAWERNLEER